MALIDVVQAVCAPLAIRIPTSFMASTERVYIDLKAVIQEVAKRIAFDTGHDWTKLKATATLTGDGTSEGLDMPSDYKRMLKKASVWPSTSPFTTLTHYPDTDSWLGFQVQNFQPLVGGWTLIGEQMHILPVLESAATVKFAYLSNLIVKPTSGDNKVAFTADNDTFRLDERLLILGSIVEWKIRKGQAYAEPMETYEDALAQEIGKDQGSNILTVGRRGVSYGAEPAYPGTVGQ